MLKIARGIREQELESFLDDYVDGCPLEWVGLPVLDFNLYKEDMKQNYLSVADKIYENNGGYVLTVLARMDEGELLYSFSKLVKERDPEIVAGFESQMEQIEMFNDFKIVYGKADFEDPKKIKEFKPGIYRYNNITLPSPLHERVEESYKISNVSLETDEILYKMDNILDDDPSKKSVYGILFGNDIKRLLNDIDMKRFDKEYRKIKH